jgi:DNA-binding NarL/FixJ family response regulator
MSRGEPKPRIIVMTTYESEGDVRRVLKAGAKGYLVKGADPQQIREAIRKVAAGQSLESAKKSGVKPPCALVPALVVAA